MKELLTDRVAIINGGATGMGQSTAFLFSEEGCHCVIADIKEEEGKKTAKEATKKGRECIFVDCDITDLKQIKNCVDKTVEKFGKVEILVGCAGGSIPRSRVITPPAPGETPKMGIQYTDEKYYDMMMALNLKGHVFFAKEVAPYMIEQKYGKIVLISSLGVYSPPGPSSEYHGAKAGIMGLVINLAFELAPHNITVNGILPGPIKTPFWDPVLANVPENERGAALDRIGQNVPLGRVGLPEDIANTVLFLCSDMSSWITGQNINVGGSLPLNRYRGGGIMQPPPEGRPR